MLTNSDCLSNSECWTTPGPYRRSFTTRAGRDRRCPAAFGATDEGSERSLSHHLRLGRHHLTIVLPTPGARCPKSSCSRRQRQRPASRLRGPKRFSSGPRVRHGPHKASEELRPSSPGSWNAYLGTSPRPAIGSSDPRNYKLVLVGACPEGTCRASRASQSPVTFWPWSLESAVNADGCSNRQAVTDVALHAEAVIYALAATKNKSSRPFAVPAELRSENRMGIGEAAAHVTRPATPWCAFPGIPVQAPAPMCLSTFWLPSSYWAGTS